LATSEESSTDGGKHAIIQLPVAEEDVSARVACVIQDVSPLDMGRYELRVLHVDKSLVGKLDMYLYVKAEPIVTLTADSHDLLYPVSSGQAQYTCVVTAYPLIDAKVMMSLKRCEDRNCESLAGVAFPLQKTVKSSDSITNAVYQANIGPLRLHSGLVSCEVCATGGCNSSQLPLLVSDNASPLRVTKEENGEGDVVLSCSASRILFEKLFWHRRTERGDGFHRVGEESEEQLLIYPSQAVHDLTLESNLTITKLNAQLNGNYRCRGRRRENSAMAPFLNNANFDIKAIEQLKAEAPRVPTVTPSFHNASEVKVEPGRDEELICTANGFPKPTLTWVKDWNWNGLKEEFEISDEGTRLFIPTVDLGVKEVQGVYACVANNTYGEAAAWIHMVAEKNTKKNMGIGLGVAVFVILLVSCLAFYYCRKARQRKKLLLTKKEEQFLKQGDPEALLAMDGGGQGEMGERVALLPYKEESEFPLKRLGLGSQIGAGQFGRVLKAQAFGIRKGEAVTTVAVKTLKPDAQKEHLHALMRELKILQVVGTHPNLVNLLGANTSKLLEMQLYVLLEYCHLGNLKDLLQRSRKNYRSGVMTQSKSLGKTITPKLSPDGALVDVRSSLGSGSTGLESLPASFVFSTEEALADRDDDMLTEGDLFLWSLHVVKGMKFLASRNILHGDLACRNILISEDGVAKVADFGLAKSMYQSSNYKRSSGVAVPIKWLAPEAINDGVTCN